MSLELSKSASLKNIIFSKNLFNRKYWRAWLNRNINKLKDPYLVYNFLEKFKKLKNRQYILKDPISNKLIFSPTYPQRQTALSVLYYKKKFFKGISETINNIGCNLVFDIGANIGYYSRAYSIYGDDLEIISVEPDIKNISFLSRNINDLSNIFVFHMGLSNDYGRFNLSLPSYASSRSKERKFMTGLFSAVGNENTKGTRFIDGDKFLKFLRIKPEEIGWIKIDVEGFEMNVIKGFSQTLINTNAIFEIEINKNTMNLSKVSLSEIIEFMEKNEYDSYVEEMIKERLNSNDKSCGVFDIYFAKASIKKFISKKLNLVKLNKKKYSQWDSDFLLNN